MQDLLAPTGLLLAAAITPGPNNLVVLRIASRAGVRGALPAIAGIVAGGLVLLAVAARGVGRLVALHPAWRAWMGLGGALYLAWLGACLLAAGLRGVDTGTSSKALPTGVSGLICFQLLNPKAWVMALTVVAAWPAPGLRAYLPLACLFTAVPGACLLLWSACGRLLARWLAHPAARRSVDAGMGVLLLASTALLFTDI